MSDRSQEALDGEAVAASAEQAAKDQAQLLEPPPLTPLQPVVGYSAPPIQAPVLPVTPPPDFTFNAAEWVQNIGTVTDTDNNTTATFTIPAGMVIQPGNMVACAVSCTNTTPGPTLLTGVTDSRGATTWNSSAALAASLTGPSAAFVFSAYGNDLRPGDVITFTFTRATDKVAIVLAEFQGVSTGIGTGTTAQGTSTTPAASTITYAKVPGQNTYFVAVAYAGSQVLPRPTATGGGYDAANSEWLVWHGRAAAGSHSVDLYSTNAFRQSYGFTSTLPASADWSVRACVLTYEFR